MLERLLVAALFNLVVLLLCLWRPNWGRIFLGLFFIVMAIGVHIVLVLTAPVAYLGFGATALLPPYRGLFDTVVAWNPVVFGLLAAALFYLATKDFDMALWDMLQHRPVPASTARS